MNVRDDVIDHYDRTAGSYDRRFASSFARRVHRIETDFLRSHIPTGASVLEFGAGTGRITQELLRVAGSLVSTEPAEQMLVQLNRQFAGTALKLEQAAIDDLPGLAGYGGFDVVAGLHVLPHVRDIPRALTTLGGAVRPGGTIIFDLWNRRAPYTILRQLLRRPKPVLTVYQSESEMLELISAAQMQTLRHVAWGFPLGQRVNLSLDMLGDAGTGAVTRLFSRWAYAHLFATRRASTPRTGGPPMPAAR